MIRKLTLHITAFLLVASFTSSASACYLFPFLNPFAWTCGYGCGNNCYSGGYGHSAWRSWWNHGCGYSGYYGGYRSYGGSTYSPGYNPGYGAPASDCNCNAATGPSVVPSPGAVGGTAWNTPMQPMSQGTAWRPMHRPMTAPMAWQQPGHGMHQPQFAPQQFSAQQFAPQQTAMSTMPVYGPTWEVPQHAAPRQAQASGDVYGDHEHRVIQNSYRPADRPLVRPAGYQRPMQPVRPYGRFIR